MRRKGTISPLDALRDALYKPTTTTEYNYVTWKKLYVVSFKYVPNQSKRSRLQRGVWLGRAVISALDLRLRTVTSVQFRAP